MDIVNNYYRKAAAKAGTPMPSMTAVMYSGEYDLMLIWDMQGGIEDMNWEINPNGIKWREALNEVAGSKEKADALREEYASYVRSSKSDIIRIATDD